MLVKYKDKAKVVTIPASVTSIGEKAFTWRKSLASINLPAGLTCIGEEAFEECEILSSISLYAQKPPTVVGDLYLPASVYVYVPVASLNAYRNEPQWDLYGDSLRALS
ncbi:MAG: leucine-rich repeat domain-containing protein [Treponema sp.]|jgi:hypothetical protein|nr:leucine-rich repeat domain-containing protein [Treponema sp.]